MIKQYRKSPPENNQKKNIQTGVLKKRKMYAVGFLLLGLILIVSVLSPIVSYEIFIAPGLKQNKFLSPISDKMHSIKSIRGINVADGKESADLVYPKNWFPLAEYKSDKLSKITHYTLSIPKLKISNAVVEIGGDDLGRSLIHYPQTALPGKLGATIIFGHSILPQFFNPKNYMSIFSLIPTLDLGDDIIVKYDGIAFTYRVIDKVEVKPTNLSVLDQPYDNEYLRLITCTPPGTYLKRGVVTAALVD
jgi:sortase A